MRRFVNDSTGRWAAIATASAIVFLAGCDQGDPVARSIENASVTLRMLNPAGGPPPAEARRNELYTQALSQLRGAPGEPTSAQQTAISLLTAEAESGLAEIPLEEAAAQERTLLGQIREARALLSQWQGHRVREATARQFDPTSEISEIDSAIAERDAQIAAAEDAAAALDAQIATLNNEVDTRLAEAAEERLTEASLREQARAVSAVEGEELIKGARAHQRVADALEVEAEMLRARIEQLERESTEAKLNVERLRTQRALLGRARAAVQERAQASAEQAAEAAADADATAQRLAAALVAIERARDEGAALAQAYEKGLTGLNRALSAANRAQSDQSARQGARAAVGATQQAIGDAHNARVRGTAAYAELLQALVAADGLEGSAASEANLAAARDSIAEDRQAASDAYEAARTAFSGSGARGDEVRARIERLDALLQNLSGVSDADQGGDAGAGDDSGANGG